MKPNTLRGLNNAISLLYSTGEFDTLRRFLLSENSSEKPETDEVIKHVCDEIRQHLVTHATAIAAIKRAY